MPIRENIHITKSLLLLATVTSASLQTSASVDTRDFDSAAFYLHFGATAPAVTSISVEESDDNSNWTAAAAAAVVNDYDTTAALPNTTVRVAYIGSKRYARIKVTPSASTILTITGEQCYPHQAPVDNPV